MLIKIFEFVIDAATLIFILGAGIAVGRFLSTFTESAGKFIKDKMPDNVYSVISIITSLSLTVLLVYKIIVD